MNEALLYLSRHNAWASKVLLATCRTITPVQLTAPAPAAYGSIIETFNHLVTSEGAHLSSLGGPVTTWVAAARHEREQHPEPWTIDDAREQVATLDELSLRVDELDRLWESFFTAAEFDPERTAILDLGTYACPAGIVMAQSFHHGSVHREQICATLTALGVDPPDVQPWAFADATGRSRLLGGRTSY
ncbi:MAG TPA: DinB family protein [Acidimicrobiales bacterium]|jgi:uncharacterized damage-inducible protein DinB